MNKRMKALLLDIFEFIGAFLMMAGIAIHAIWNSPVGIASVFIGFMTIVIVAMNSKEFFN